MRQQYFAVMLVALFLAARAAGFYTDDDGSVKAAEVVDISPIVGETRSVEVRNPHRSVADSFYSWAKETAPESAQPSMVVVHQLPPRADDVALLDVGDAAIANVATMSPLSSTTTTDSGMDGSSSSSSSSVRRKLSPEERKLVREIANVCAGLECIQERCDQQTSISLDRCVTRAVSLQSKVADQSQPLTPLEVILARLDATARQRVLDVAIQAALAETDSFDRNKNEITTTTTTTMTTTMVAAAASANSSDIHDYHDTIVPEDKKTMPIVLGVILLLLKLYIVYRCRKRILEMLRSSSERNRSSDRIVHPPGIFSRARPMPPPVLTHDMRQLSPPNP